MRFLCFFECLSFLFQGSPFKGRFSLTSLKKSRKNRIRAGASKFGLFHPDSSLYWDCPDSFGDIAFFGCFSLLACVKNCKKLAKGLGHNHWVLQRTSAMKTPAISTGMWSWRKIDKELISACKIWLERFGAVILLPKRCKNPDCPKLTKSWTWVGELLT